MSELKALLKQHEITQSSLAKPLGVSVPAINLFVLHGIRPKKKADLFVSQFIEQLKAKGIDETKINQAIDAVLNASNLETQSTQSSANTQLSEEQLMLLRKQTLSQDAKEKFGLFNNIFTTDVRDPKQLFCASNTRYVLEAMWQAAIGNSSFIAVIGQSGSGKSTCREELHDRVQREAANTIIIEPYVLATEENDIKGKSLKSLHIAESILNALAPSTNAKRSPEARFRQVHNLLKESKRNGNHHVLIIEESQCLPTATLKHLKRFLELKNGYKPLLSIILIGQDELKIRLSENNPEVREVVQRCEIVTLKPFTPTTLVDYLNHRCSSVGRNLNEFIDQSGLDAICEKLHRNIDRHNEHESLLYPLAIGNLITAALNKVVDLGLDDVITGDLIRELRA
ncbi:ExeA family protein [Acinetobacter wuhouensis]|uniref:Transposase n=1 Tax=Acinetobacter wuhouensis TaxID=1879050 RepID=A0A3G2T3U5_9GAMM|nr:AAA family ATPase [Acinetobacter wuhouensis]AYO54939.1 transposase [Acinetobacter wuhouensis]